MTREEAIKELKEDIELYIPLHGTIDDVDRELPDGRLITALEMAIKVLEQESRKGEWETCFECPLSHGCPKIKGCTNEQAIEYAGKIPNDCPLSAQPEQEPCEDAISRQAVLDYINRILNQGTGKKKSFEFIQKYVEKLSPVNPQPKTGHWIEEIDDYGNIIGWHCDKCYEDSGFTTDCKWGFCPNCGAKMSGIPTGSEPQENEKINCKTTKCENCINHNYCDYESQERNEKE